MSWIEHTDLSHNWQIHKDELIYILTNRILCQRLQSRINDYWIRNAEEPPSHYSYLQVCLNENRQQLTIFSIQKRWSKNLFTNLYIYYYKSLCQWVRNNEHLLCIHQLHSKYIIVYLRLKMNLSCDDAICVGINISWQYLITDVCRLTSQQTWSCLQCCDP